MSPDELKAVVAAGYDRCADAYAAARSDSPPAELAALADRLEPGAEVLDIGCGCGLPVTRYLASRFAVTGVDISERQIALARNNVSAARLIHGDIMDQRFPPASFDAIVIAYALFHLPRAEHDALIRRMSGWSKAGGLAFVTVATEPEAVGREDDFFGSPMVWSSYSRDEYPPMFAAHGFRVLTAGVLGSGFFASFGLPDEIHPFFLLQQEAGARSR